MHSQRPLISIIIPTVNRATWLGQALQSALAQTCNPGIEVVVVDNACTDDSWDVIQAHSHGAVRTLKNPQRLNICDNWQLALEAAQGEYVLVLGDDDCLFPQWGKVMLDIIKEHLEKDKPPSYIGWNHITYIDDVPLSGWKKLLCYPRKLSADISTINGESLRDAYLRQESILPLPVYPHPSLFLFHRAQIDFICQRFNTLWFEGLYPDYHAGVLAGEFTTNGLFVNQALVCIGGLEKRYYCRKQSKMERFSEGQEANHMPDLGDGFGTYSPYLALNIARQMVYSCRIINHPIDKEVLLKKLIPETIENIWFCECVFGHGSHRDDIDRLTKKFDLEHIQNLVKHAKKVIFRARINRILLLLFGRKCNIALRSILTNRPTVMVTSRTINNLNSAIQWYLTHRPHETPQTTTKPNN